MPVFTLVGALSNVGATTTAFANSAITAVQSRRESAVALHGNAMMQQMTEPDAQLALQVEPAVQILREMSVTLTEIADALRRLQMLGRKLEGERARISEVIE